MIRSITLRTVLPILFLSTGMRSVEGQGDVSLYLRDDPASYLVTTIPADDPRLDGAVELPPDDSRDHTWKMMELQQAFDGYVRKSYVTKGLTVQPGAPVYFDPGNEDAFLTILSEGATAEVIEAAGDWVQVSVEATLPVYFESRETTLPDLPDLDAPADTATTNYEPESAVAEDDMPRIEPADIGPGGGPYPGEPIDRILEGTLKPYKPFFSNPWSQPAYKWEILNRNKKRIAFLDPSDLILNRPLETYSGQRVSLSGSIYQINNGKDLVIVANHLNLL